MKFMTVAALSLAATIAVAAPASAAVTYNANLADPGVYYGSGNDYSPGNFTINTDHGVELALRAHERGQAASASVNNVFSFALGQEVSFDWSFNPSVNGSVTPTYNLFSFLTVTNLGTGATATFNPFLVLDNAHDGDAPGGIQNSWTLNFALLNGQSLLFGLIPPVGDIDYDKNADTSYSISWDVWGNGFQMNDTIYIKQGAGSGTIPGVPEAGTWAMMLIGFGALGMAMRRRRATVSFA